MNLKWALATIVLCLGSFAYGIKVRHSEIFPYEYVRILFRAVHEKPIPELADFDLDISEVARAMSDLDANLEDVRARLKAKVIFPEDMVTLTTREVAPNRDEITAQIYGVKTRAIHSKVPENASCLRVYIQGHKGDPFAREAHNALLETSLAEGCDVVSMSMIARGLNTGEASFPSGKYSSQVSRMDWEEARRAGSYFLYYDKDLPEMSPLGLFLSPHYYIIGSLSDDYEEVSILGMSTGGWYSVWMSALRPEIDHSIIYAGSLPLLYRTATSIWANIMEHASYWIYRDTDYWHLYYLGSHAADADRARPMYFVYNDKDPCCYMDPAASHFEAVAREVYGDDLRIVIDESIDHTMNVEVVEAIWSEVSEVRLARD